MDADTRGWFYDYLIGRENEVYALDVYYGETTEYSGFKAIVHEVCERVSSTLDERFRDGLSEDSCIEIFNDLVGDWPFRARVILAWYETTHRNRANINEDFHESLVEFTETENASNMDLTDAEVEDLVENLDGYPDEFSESQKRKVSRFHIRTGNVPGYMPKEVADWDRYIARVRRGKKQSVAAERSRLDTNVPDTVADKADPPEEWTEAELPNPQMVTCGQCRVDGWDVEIDGELTTVTAHGDVIKMCNIDDSDSDVYHMRQLLENEYNTTGSQSVCDSCVESIRDANSVAIVTQERMYKFDSNGSLVFSEHNLHDMPAEARMMLSESPVSRGPPTLEQFQPSEVPGLGGLGRNQLEMLLQSIAEGDMRGVEGRFIVSVHQNGYGSDRNYRVYYDSSDKVSINSAKELATNPGEYVTNV